MSDTQSTVSEALRWVEAAGSLTGVDEVIRAAIPAPPAGFTDSVATIARQLEQLQAAALNQAATLAENTQAVTQNTVAQNRGGAASVAGSIASTAARVWGGGLSLMPLASAIVGLFTGHKSEAPPPLTAYAAPPTIQFQGTVPGAGQPILAVDYGQDGKPRTLPATAPFYATPITVQVQALDSRSFLDHSEDIARAVREAILSAHALGDVVSEL